MAATVDAEDVSSTAAEATRPNRQNRLTLSSELEAVAVSSSRLQVRAAMALCCMGPSIGFVHTTLPQRPEAPCDGLHTSRGFSPEDDRPTRSEEHTSELQSLTNLVCRL